MDRGPTLHDRRFHYHDDSSESREPDAIQDVLQRASGADALAVDKAKLLHYWQPYRQHPVEGRAYFYLHGIAIHPQNCLEVLLLFSAFR